MKKIIFLFSFLSISILGIAQSKQKFTFDSLIIKREDSLKLLSQKTLNGEDEFVRRNSTFAFIKLLVRTLKSTNSFYYPFDSLTSISILNPKDNSFRIFTWHLRFDDGSFRYYGAIQKNNSEKLELYPLFDQSNEIEKPEDTVLSNEYWVGAHYYTILQNKSRGKKYYTLLGWKGNDTITNKKIIDVLRFDKENAKPIFGAPIFTTARKNEFKNRIVFEYNIEAVMSLRYLKEKKWIIFDHLSPINEAAKDIPAAYGPDFTYDGYKFSWWKGKWKLMEDIDIRNDKSPNDDIKPKQVEEGLFGPKNKK